MAISQSRKRQHTDDLLSQGGRPGKKSRSEVETPNFSSQSLDEIFVPLTSLALQELDRQNNLEPPSQLETQGNTCYCKLSLFARQGGPDLCHLRGYPEPNANPVALLSSSSRFYGLKTRTQSVDATRMSTAPSSVAELEQCVDEQGVYFDTPKSSPQNLQEILEGLSRSQPFLSSSQFPDGSFENFQQKIRGAIFDDQVMNEIISILCGDTDQSHKMNTSFTELEPIAKDDAVKPKPYFFDGSCLGAVDQRIQTDKQMYPMLVPTKLPEFPVAPNFFLEAKRRDDNAAVITQQARYDGAYGARAMHSLQNYGREAPVHDGNAYAFSSIYDAGTGMLQLFAHHTTLPTTHEAQPEYHMTQLKGFDLTSDPKSFIDGVTAFRNARDLAKQYRDNFIVEANLRAKEIRMTPRQVQVTTPSTAGVSDAATQTFPVSHAALQNNNMSTQSLTAEPVFDPTSHLFQEAHDALQRDIFDQSFTELVVPLSTKEDPKGRVRVRTFPMQNLIGLPAIATNFISNFNAGRADFMRCMQLHY